MSDDMIPIGLNDPMKFNCSSDNPCFNECCRDLNQALTPYDILRLKKALGMSSQDFLREFTSRHSGPDSGLPIITFKPNPATGHACPFVKEEGCSVYDDRPASCRMYPLARAIARSRETQEVAEFFALIEEDHCQGFYKGDKTVSQWLAGQDVDLHNQNNDKLMDLISLKNKILPGRLEGAQSDFFYLALYDLDEYREQIENHGCLDGFELPPEVLEKLLSSDEVLLDFGIAWVKNMLFGIELTVDI